MRLNSVLVGFFMLVGFMYFCGMAQAQENLTVYYDFETEEATDQSGNSLDGVVIGGNPELIDGAVGKAWQFDGGIMIEMDYPEFKVAHTELSMRCFIKPEDVQNQHIIYEEGGAWTGFCVRIRDVELEFEVVCCGEDHPPPVFVSAELPKTEDWMEIAAVFDKGTIFLYIDGKKVGEEKTEWAELGDHGQAGGIGEKQSGDTAFNDGSGFFVGGIDEFRVYSRALQPAELDLSVSALGKLAITWADLKIYY